MKPAGVLLLGAMVLVVGTCVAGATAGSQATTAGPAYKVVGSWGKAGNANGQFVNAYGLATDKAGNLYVADTDNNRIQVFSAKGAFLRKWGTAGIGNGQFLSPHDVAISPDGSVWVADYRNNRLQQFDSGGGFKQAIAIGGATGVGIDSDGNVFVSYIVGGTGRVGRYDKASDFAPAKTWGGVQSVGDVEVSADGSIYVADLRGAPPNVKRFDSTGKLLNTIKLQMPATAGAGAQFGIGVDLDCNVWATNASQRNLARYSPTGKLLGTATSGDLIAVDIAVGRNGDLYASDNGTRSIVHFAEDKSKPATAAVPGAIVVTKGVAKVKYTLSGVACPAEVDAAASLTGKGISGKTTVKLAAGKTTVISIPVKAAAGTSTSATFKIVLKTNGRPTTQTRSIKVSVR